MSRISANNLSKVFHHGQADEVTALEDMTLHIEQGEAVALTGPSGSGKSTLLSLLGCLARPTSGSVQLEDRQVSRLPEHILARLRREHYGFIFQQYHLLREQTVLQNIILPLFPSNMSWRSMKAEAWPLLERFALDRLARRKVKQLSGGEQQRVAIARALVANPQVVIADEPTAHLDAELSADLLELLAALKGEGRTLIVATHDPLLTEARLIDRRIALRHGRLEPGGAVT